MSGEAHRGAASERVSRLSVRVEVRLRDYFRDQSAFTSCRASHWYPHAHRTAESHVSGNARDAVVTCRRRTAGWARRVRLRGDSGSARRRAFPEARIRRNVFAGLKHLEHLQVLALERDDGRVIVIPSQAGFEGTQPAGLPSAAHARQTSSLTPAVPAAAGERARASETLNANSRKSISSVHE